MKIIQTSIKRKRTTALSLVILALGFLALPQRTQAISPPPDGGYPGGNTAEGQNALGGFPIGSYNTAIGFSSLLSLTDASFNTGVGAGTLLANIAAENTATGAAALLSNTTGGDNTANGAFALFSNITGTFNTATGFQALENSTGDRNTANGADALLSNTSGIQNTADGNNALRNSVSGNTNVALGAEAGSGVTTASNVICIGANVAGNDVNNSCYIGNIFGDTSSGGTAVFVNSNGRLGTTTSSRRFKEEIKPMDRASEALFALRPVTFRYKKEIDPPGIAQFGLVAEEVEKADPDLVVRDKEGKPYSVRYDQVNAMLLNEFLKEHKKVEGQQSTIDNQQASIVELKSTVAQQQKGMEILAAQVKEQAAQIQKVSAQLEVSKPATKVVVNKP
jgi:hypothetical protein